jgi:hypothetical protein
MISAGEAHKRPMLQETADRYSVDFPNCDGHKCLLIGYFMVRPYVVIGTICKSVSIHQLAGSPSIALDDHGCSQKG